MFYNTEMLTKRGPLARVWMASHLSTKLSKSHLLATSIPSSVGSILGEALLPMALRLSGQLLLGVARIYSRKAKYLLEDCNDTLTKVKRAFRPGAVDMEEGEGRSREAINLRAEQGGLEDILNNDAGLNYWDMDFNADAVAGPSQARNPKANTSTNAEISLPENIYAGYSELDYGDVSGLNFDAGGLDEGFELGILDDDEMMLDLLPDGDEFDLNDPKGKKRARSDEGSDDESVEAGRDAPGSVGRASARGSLAGPEGKGGEDILDGEGDVTMGSAGGGFDFGEGGLGGMEDGDYGIVDDFGGGEYPMGTPRRAEIEDESLALTPKTAADLAKAAPRATKKTKVAKKQVVDRVTELEWEGGARALQKESLFAEPRFLPADRIHLRLLELSNPSAISHHVPQLTSTKGDYFNAAPPGMPSALHDLFTFPSRRARIAADASRKREGTVDEMIEQGRRGAQQDLDYGLYEPEAYQDDFGVFAENPTSEADGFRFDVDEGLPTPAKMGGDDAAPRASQAAKKQKLSNERDADLQSEAQFEVENFDIVHSTSSGPLAVFDDPSSGLGLPAPSQSVNLTSTQRESLAEDEEENLLNEGAEPVGRWSKNTVKAITIIKTELAAAEEGEPVVFATVAKEASRRAAASFFFELLVLSTRDCIKIKQAESFGQIEVTARAKLYEDGQGQGIEA